MLEFDSVSAFSGILDAVLPIDGGYVAIMYQVYFDESGTHRGSKVMAMSGYIFEKRQARLFSKAWQRDLSDLGLTHAHMTDCVTGNAEYQSLTMAQRILSEKKLIALIKKYSLGSFSITMEPDIYNSILDEKFRVLSAYTFLLLMSVNKISSTVKEIDPTAKIAYIFEAGHQHSTEANKFMNGINPYGGELSNNYASHSFVDKRIALPLQAADMLVWQFRHQVERQLKNNFKMRADFEALLRTSDVYSKVEKIHVLALRKLYAAIMEAKPKNYLEMIEVVRNKILGSGL